MTINVKLSLYSPEEKEAFAEFLKISAAADRNRPQGILGLGGLVGGIDREQTPFWHGLASPELAEKLAAAAQNVEAAQAELPLEQPAEEPAKKERKPRAKKEATPVEVPATPAEVKAQDEADEQAESDAAAEERGHTLTHDDIRSALGSYVKKFGMPAAQEDGPKLFGLVFPEGGVVKISDIPDTQEALSKALAGVKELLEKNPYERKAV